MLDKLAELFGSDYQKYLKRCEKDGTTPLSKDEWRAKQPKKESC